MIRQAGVLVLLALVALGGCGYSLRGTLPSHLQSIAIPVFKNRTQQPAVENFLTRAVVEAFATNGRLRVVPTERADSVLEGEVTGYEVQAIAFDAQANVRQFRLVVTMDLRFTDLRQKQVLFDRKGLQERANFAIPGTVSQTIALEETALRTAAVDVGRAIVAFTIERF